jgi:hypothetical protein
LEAFYLLGRPLVARMERVVRGGYKNGRREIAGS